MCECIQYRTWTVWLVYPHLSLSLTRTHTHTHTHTHTYTHTHTQFPYITSNDVTSIETIVRSKSNFSGVDLLLTSDWPKGVENHTSVPEGLNMRHVGSEAVARLAMAVRPRYHFAGTMQCFYERIPYRYMLMYMYMGAES